MAGRESWQTGNPKMAGGPVLKIVAQVFKMVEIFKNPVNFAQHVFGLDGWNQASAFTTEQREINGL